MALGAVVAECGYREIKRQVVWLNGNLNCRQLSKNTIVPPSGCCQAIRDGRVATIMPFSYVFLGEAQHIFHCFAYFSPADAYFNR